MDVQIVGAGPAGLALSIELAERGVRVKVCGGDDRPWVPNYGLWTDESASLGIDDCMGSTWSDSEVWTSSGERLSLGRGYGRVDKHALRSKMLGRAAAAGVDVAWTRVDGAAHDVTGTTLETCSGSTRSTLVIDASGHQPALVRREGEPTLWQAAYGVAGRLEGHGWSRDAMTFMDFRQPPPVDALAGIDATFLYAMPLGGDDIFVEETSLMRAPAMPFATLRNRLASRLGEAGLTLAHEHDVELCLFPMDPPLPDLTQRVVGFGAAASMVHPATGYSLARSLRAAPVLAEVLSEGLGRGTAPELLAETAWRTLWTPDLLVARQLQLYGSRILADMGPTQVSGFFETFFSRPPFHWKSYLKGDDSSRSVANAMVSTFLGCNAGMRWTLARASHRLPGALWRQATA